MSDTLDNNPHVGERTGSGEWVVRATLRARYPAEDDIVGFLGGPIGVTRVRRHARRFINLGDALRAGYDTPKITEMWTGDELPVKASKHQVNAGTTGRA